jgi:hypothetical protein
MRISPRTARAVLLLTLLVLQVQVLASVALGCRHAADGGLDPVAGAVCPMHGVAGQVPSPDDPPPEPLLDCQKCALHCAVAVYPLANASPMLPPVEGAGDPAARPEGHFYRFTPESFLKPPIG